MSSFALKITALILMLLDHDLPISELYQRHSHLVYLVGRLSAPIFYFCMAQGLTYTHSRKAYLLRMYLFSIAMSIGNLTLTTLLPNAPSGGIPNNIFASLLLGAAIIVCMEEIAKDRQKRPADLDVLHRY